MNWEGWSSGSLIGLTLLGAFMAATRNVADRKLLKAFYVVLFFAIGGFAFYADITSKDKSRKENEERYAALERQITGGDNFPYLVPDQNNLSNPLQLKIATGKNSHLFNVEVYVHPLASQGDSKEASYWTNGYRKTDYVPPWGLRTDLFLPFGDWRVELNARNGHWIQIIHFTEAQGKLIFLTTVMKNGAIIFDTDADGLK